jgi:CBS domain-containing protein
MFMSSAALGGAFAMGVNYIFPAAHLSPGAYALVAMAAVFGAASRATFAFIVFAFEITHDFNAILPLMLGCVIADLIALRYLPTSIMTEKLARRGLSVPGEYEVSVLNHVRVGSVMRTDVKPISPDMPVAELAERVFRAKPAGEATADREPTINFADGLPIAGSDGVLMGIVTQSDLLRAMENDPSGKTTVIEAGSSEPIVAFPDERVHDAMSRMLHHNIGRLPVVSREDSRKLVGYFSRSNVLSAWSRQIEEEGVREHGWAARWGHRPEVGRSTNEGKA